MQGKVNCSTYHNGTFPFYLMALLVPYHLLVLWHVYYSIKTKCFKFWNKHYTIFLYVFTGTCITKYVLILIILWVLLNTAGYSWGYIHVFDQSTKSLYWISSDCITNIAKREIITKKDTFEFGTIRSPPGTEIFEVKLKIKKEIG